MKMTWNLDRLIVCVGILLVWNSISVASEDSARGLQKAIVKNDILYMSRGFALDAPRAGLLAVTLSDGARSEETPITVREEPDYPFPFCWDIEGTSFVIILGSTIPTGYGFFSLGRLPFVEGGASQPLILRKRQWNSIDVDPLSYAFVFERDAGPTFLTSSRLMNKHFCSI